MNSIIRALIPYGLVRRPGNVSFKRLIKNILPAGIVELIIKRNSEKKYTADYLRNNYVSDLTDNEKWVILAFLLMLERRTSEVDYLEVGVYAGGTIKFLQENCQKVHFTGIDLFEDFIPAENNTHIWHNYSRNIVLESLDSSIVQLEKGDSHLVLDKLCKEGRKFDFIFIDGNHTYEATRDDLEHSIPLLRENGFVAFHNCSPGLTQEDRYYLKLDGGPWMLTQELTNDDRFRLIHEIERIKIFQIR